MANARLRILNVPDASEWEAVKHLPRFIQRQDFSTNPCATCPGHCCSPEGNITTVETMRMALGLGMPPSQVVQARRVADLTHDTSASEPLPIPLAGGDVLFFMHLLGRGKRCSFLHTVAGRGVCSIYGLRPGICRVYPFTVAWKGKVMRVGSTSLCQVKWVQDDAVRAGAQEALEAWDQDIRQEKLLLRAWQRHPGEDRSLDAYFRFAAARLQKRMGGDLELLFPVPRRRLGDPDGVA